MIAACPGVLEEDEALEPESGDGVSRWSPSDSRTIVARSPPPMPQGLERVLAAGRILRSPRRLSPVLSW